jgi:hypothetical protein
MSSKLSSFPLATSIGPNAGLVGFDPAIPSTDQLFPPALLAGVNVVVSTSALANPQAGQLWFNPTTQLLSVAQIPSYSWSEDLAAGPVVLSGSDRIATRNDSTYPNIVSPGAQAGVASASILPATQKYVFAITTSMDLSGDSGFGIGNDAQTLGNGMFLGSPNPSAGIAYYVENLAFYYFVNNAVPLSGSSTIGNGLNYVAIDPVAKKMWVKPNGGNWNGNPANNPAAGTGGVSFTFDVTTARIIAQLWVNGDAATIDPAAAGLSVPAGFTPLSQITLWQPLTYSNPSAISAGWVNINDSFGAVGDGVADDGPAFQRFTKAYQGKEVCLFLPPGKHYRSGSNWLGLWMGIKKLTIIGYGATLDAINSFGGVNDSASYTTALSGFIATANAGDTQLTLSDIGDASKFTGGDWIMVGALSMEVGGNSIPPTFQYFEYVQITTISGTTVFLDSPLKGGPYKSTYPYYTATNTSGQNEGGPARIYRMPRGTWDADFLICGVKFLNLADFTNIRDIYYKDCSWPGLQSTNRPNPTVCRYVTWDNCLIEGGSEIELDKNFERLVYRNCKIGGYYNTLLFQSGSINQLIIEGCDIETLAGTPKNTYIRDSYIGSLIPTPRVSGVMESLYVENSYIGDISFTGWSNAFGGAELLSAYTFSNGTFSKANTGGVSQVPWACPGAKCFFQGGGGFNFSPPFFTVLDVRGDSSTVPSTGNVHIDTTLASLPTWTQGTDPSSAFLPTVISQHPYGKITFKNCRGAQLVQNWENNSNPFKDEGVGFSYSRIVLTGNRLSQSAPNSETYGTLVSININVLRAYTGANGSENVNFAGFNTYPGGTFAGAASPTLVVNAKTAGVRSWAAGAWTGGVAGDTLPAITSGTWLYGLVEWFFDTDMSGDNLSQTPIVVIETITDAGIIKYDLLQYGTAIVKS